MIYRRASRTALCCVMAVYTTGLVAHAVHAADADATKLPPAANKEVDFVRDVRPIFQRACFRCHGPDKQKSEYRLDVRKTALTGGESYAPNIVPGKSADSPLVKMAAGVGDVTMPPEGDRLSVEEIGLLRAWIDQGAKWPDEVAGELKDKSDWWAFKPLPQRRAKDGNEAASTPQSIDAFVRAKLDSVGLRPAQQADRRTLVRRIYFDLIGLPPTPEEVDSFVADPDPKAYEKLVDQLLESPRYGERWARHWLDAAHFAETHGHDQDRIRENAWPYRDYLIQSLNADKPYARFVQEQVAGDVLFPDDPQATVALGFLAAGPWDESSLQSIREESLDRQIARYIDRDDMIANVINNFSSLTVQCARCHDHKFDPISQADYYSLQAVFSGVERANRRYDSDPAVQRRRTELQRRKSDSDKPSAETIVSLLSAESQRVVAEWEDQLATRAVVWRVLDPTEFTSSDGATLTKQPDNSILSGGMRPEQDTVTITATSPLAKVTAIRLEVLTDDSLPLRGPGRQDNGNLHLSEFEVFREGSTAPIEIAHATADFDQQGWGIAKAIDKSEPTAWGIHPQVGRSHVAVFELKAPLTLALSPEDGGEGTKPLLLKLVLKQRHGRQHLIGRMRLSVTEAVPPVRLDAVPERIAAILATPREQRSEAQRVELTVFQQLEEVERELASLPKPSLIYAAAADFEPDGGLRPPPGPRPVHVLHRGDIRSPREAALPGALGCVKELPSRFELPNANNEAARRAALAKWLTDTQNSLTWRSIVNRVWHHHFGRGLVGTLNDFGHMGETPSHPELLDWLAVEFRDGGQSLKQLHRLIVTSETYRQASALPRGSALAGESAPVPSPPSSGERARVREPSGDAATTAEKPEEEKTPHPNPLPASISFFQDRAGRGDKAQNPNSIDADNRLLWRMNRTRLDAECVRDAVVAISGRMDLRMGGPSDRQFDLQPGIHVTPKIDYAKFDLNSDLGRRRSIYRFLFRTLPDPFMETLDCPSGDQITPARTTSVTVQQALALWNDAFIARHCEFIAVRIEKEVLSRQPISRQPTADESISSVHSQIDRAVRLILCRPPTEAESRDLSEYASKHGLANVCRLLLNSNEFLFVN